LQRLDSLLERQLALGAALSLLLNASGFFVLALAFHPVSIDEPEVVPVELVSLPAPGSPAPVLQEREPLRPEVATASPSHQTAESKPTEQPAALKPPTPEEPPARAVKSVEPEPEASVAELPAELPIPTLPPKPAQAMAYARPHEAAAPAAEADVEGSSAAPAQAMAPTVQEVAAAPSVALIDAAATKAALGQYASRLHGLIEAHKSYPAQAMIRREEGTVVLRIVIEHDGKLLDVEALSGSPSRLVEASVQATKAAGPFPSFPREIDLPRATFELPITFRLQ